MALNYEKLTYLNLKSHPTINEIWIQDRIAEDSTILGLGDPKKHTELLRELFTTAHKEFGASNG